MKKLAVLVSVLALAAFGIAACGGDDDNEETTEAAPATTTTEAGGGGGGGGGGTVDVSASEGISYDQASLETSAGTVTINFTNESGIDHDVVIEDADGNEVTSTDIISSGSTSAEADLQAGEYTFFCSVDAHREQGMEGPLTVK